MESKDMSNKQNNKQGGNSENMVSPRDVRASGSKPNDTKPNATRPKATKPNVTRPNVTRPNVTRPNVARPNVARPNVARPNVARPNVARPNVARPNITEPSTTEPNITEPNITEPSNIEPNATKPNATKPNTKKPNATKPNIMRPNNQNIRHKNDEQVQKVYSEDEQSTQKRDSIVDVDAENENYFINGIGYDELVTDETTRDLDRKEEKQEAKKRTPEQIKKLKIIKISAGSAGVLLITGLIVLNVFKSDQGFTINKVDITGHEPVYITAEQIESTVNNTTVQSTKDAEAEETSEPSETSEPVDSEPIEETRVERVYTIINPESDKEYDIGSFVTKKFQVNSKPIGADEYVVRDTQYDCGLEEVYTGDTVKEIIEQYNANNKANKEIAIDFDSIDDNTFIVARVGCQYPVDYPTSNGMAYEIPEISVKVVGTYIEEETSQADETSTVDDETNGQIWTPEADPHIGSEIMDSNGKIHKWTDDDFSDYLDIKEFHPVLTPDPDETSTTENYATVEVVEPLNKYSDKVEVNGKIYTLEAPIAIHDIPNSISVASGYNFDYLIQMPSGAKADSYKFIVTINGQEIVYRGIDVN